MTYNYFQLFWCDESADQEGFFIIILEYQVKIQSGCDQFSGCRTYDLNSVGIPVMMSHRDLNSLFM